MLKLPVLWIEDSDTAPVLKDVYFFTIDRLYAVDDGVVVVSAGVEYKSPIEFNELIELLCQEK